MLRALANSFKIADLRQRILLTLGLIAVYRIGCYIPTPGINGRALAEFFDRMARTQGGTLFAVMDLFSGAALSQCTIFALGIMPAISASIIMQLLTVVLPDLEKLAKEGGEAGRRQLNQYSRYLTVGLGVLQALFISLWLENPAHFDGVAIVHDPGWGFRLTTVITLASGTAFIMWLGEQITAYGIGNGMSILITSGIISRVPTAAHQLWVLMAPGASAASRQIQPVTLLLMAVMMVAVVIAVIAITQGQRRIPVQYARRVVGRKVYGGQTTYIPIRVNHAGVMPIIFAQSIIMFPATLAGFFPNRALQAVSHWLTNGQWFYTILYSALIVFFAYFYTAISFNPIEVADNMRKYGGFVPGIRPGRPTAEYFGHILDRITLPGAVFLAVIAVLPDMVGKWLKIPYSVASFFGGTGLLIIVGVMLDTMRQIESFLLMRHYEGFMKRGRLRGRR
ncbi:MAG: preprotein translocase subunit SecY [Candidatus Omnitrophica bacterium]|nr:preprotein translocase subunit SecY [Candidatus Omnitrophota bacterium]